MKALILVLCLASLGCASAPPNLSPAAHVAFVNTRVIKGLDLLRDTAVDGNAQQPPVISTTTTRTIVRYHEATLKIIHAAGTGWKPAVLAGLEELLINVPASEQVILKPYVALTKTILMEVQ